MHALLLLRLKALKAPLVDFDTTLSPLELSLLDCYLVSQLHRSRVPEDLE